MAMRRWLMMAAAIAAIGLGTPALAQAGTPAPESEASAACDAVQPRDAEGFAALAESPQATPADAAANDSEQGADATPVTAELPGGDPAEDAAVAEITELYETLIDCLNRADYLRAYALYTDDYLLANFDADVLAQLDATPVPVEASTETAFGGVLEARELGDGRFVALVTTSNPNTGEVLLKSTMNRENGRLRIAEELVVAAETPATPEA